jgi:hypothetical protein
LQPAIQTDEHAAGERRCLPRRCRSLCARARRGLVVGRQRGSHQHEEHCHA